MPSWDLYAYRCNSTLPRKCLAMALVLVFLVGVVFPKISAAISALSVPAALSAPAATVVAASTACVDGDTEVLTADRKKVGFLIGRDGMGVFP